MLCTSWMVPIDLTLSFLNALNFIIFVISNIAFDSPMNFAFQIAHFSYRTLKYRFLLCYLVSSASLIDYYLVHYWRYFSLFSVYKKHSIIEKTDNKKYTFKSTNQCKRTIITTNLPVSGKQDKNIWDGVLPKRSRQQEPSDKCKNRLLWKILQAEMKLQKISLKRTLLS